MDQQSLLQNLLNLLEHVKERPAMFIGHVEPAAAVAFLSGFSVAAGTALKWNSRHRLDVLQRVTESRGWRWTSTGPRDQMVSKGWTSRKIVTELIEIQADFIQKMTETTLAEKP